MFRNLSREIQKIFSIESFDEQVFLLRTTRLNSTVYVYILD